MSESAFIYLVRHGEAAMPDEHGRWGLRSAGLTRRGIIQVERLARALAATDVDCIYSSDVPRAKETAAILGRKLKATPIELKNLHEIDIGKFEGMTLDVLLRIGNSCRGSSAPSLAVSRLQRFITLRASGSRVAKMCMRCTVGRFRASLSWPDEVRG